MQAFENFSSKSWARLESFRLNLHFELNRSSSRFINVDAQLKLYVSIKDIDLKYKYFIFYISLCTTNLFSLNYNKK